jgi:uncharacterized iron-regulated membrane protein
VSALRTGLFWLHLAAGLAAGAVIFVMAATGFLLAFEPQITAFAERDVRTVRLEPSATTASPSALLDAAEAARPGKRVTALTMSAKPTDAVSVALGREITLFLDPSTARVLGEGSSAARGFFRKVTDWHRWLGTGEETRPKARALTGAANVAFFLLALTGAVIWWPRKRTARNFKNVTFFQRGLSGRARDFNWHAVIGFWSSAVLLTLTSTGMVLSYRWAGNLLYRVTGNEPPPAQAPGPGGARDAGRAGRERAPRPDYDRLFAAARSQTNDWRRITMRIPQSGGPLTFSIERGESWNPYARSQLTLDPATAAVAKWETYTDANSGRKLRVWARGLHTGEPFGIPGQAVAGLASLGGTVLVWTGFAMAWRRFQAWRIRRALARETRAEAVPERAAG